MTGKLHSDELSGISAIIIEGEVFSNIKCNFVIIKNSGSVFGNIACKTFFADMGSVLVGSLNVHKDSPVAFDSSALVV
jgi:cytoskeletal protein CcmA (bactofilin family)